MNQNKTLTEKNIIIIIIFTCNSCEHNQCKRTGNMQCDIY